MNLTGAWNKTLTAGIGIKTAITDWIILNPEMSSTIMIILAVLIIGITVAYKLINSKTSIIGLILSIIVLALIVFFFISGYEMMPLLNQTMNQTINQSGVII